MSVAFRRESDEDHKEPRFELPIPAGPNLVTARGLALIDERIAALSAVIDAGGEESVIEAARRGLRYWTTRQTTAQLAPVPNGEEVAFGTRVAFRQNDTVRMIEIVGDDEADPGEGRVSFSAPLARALMGAAIGEAVDFGGQAAALEIVAITPIP
ncbi:Nucleoside-diphosphate kinase [Sphingomonas sp. EC-HK361]|uniref:GreA/GreB family elongation factor n=1 Tax=Sphingomonas sp. EC-HK361 TaxID=2038397 RepID=UPI001256D84B|nr:GreA/GreB family elongation factor [Sphingomonas sp. EC-HK361]VVS97931.1 Nucleoside-diphosphate kinase [Sphingomonas sp. EC-HK361]